MNRTYRPLTAEELAAVREYAARHGRYWKDAMRGDWYNASEPGYIQALRNSHGPGWLKTFTLPAGGVS